MINNSNYQIDLLQRRRLESNTKKFTNSSIKKLKKLGYIYGIVITLIGVTICSFTAIYTVRRVKYKEKLKLRELEYQDLKVKYDSMKESLKKIYSVNNNIAQGIIGTKSGSALLLELRKIIPTTIQLTSIKSNGKNLTLKGKAIEPNALESINSFKLQIADSFLINNDSSFLSKIETSKYRDKNSLDFTLTSNFSELETKQIQSNYLMLGSMGLLERVNILKEEKLIK